MLCYRSHEREAFVHYTKVVAQPGQTTRQDFCVSCYQEIDPAMADSYAVLKSRYAATGSEAGE